MFLHYESHGTALTFGFFATHGNSLGAQSPQRRKVRKEKAGRFIRRFLCGLRVFANFALKSRVQWALVAARPRCVLCASVVKILAGAKRFHPWANDHFCARRSVANGTRRPCRARRGRTRPAGSFLFCRLGGPNRRAPIWSRTHTGPGLAPRWQRRAQRILSASLLGAMMLCRLIHHVLRVIRPAIVGSWHNPDM